MLYKTLLPKAFAALAFFSLFSTHTATGSQYRHISQQFLLEQERAWPSISDNIVESPRSDSLAELYAPLNAINTPYTESFNTLQTTGTDIPIVNGVTIPGWYTERPWYNAGNTSTIGNTGTNYSFGSASASTERAFGSIATGTTGTLTYALRLRNLTGTTVTSLDVAFFGEQWRRAPNTFVHTLSFSYRQAPEITDLSGSYISVPALDFVSPVTGSTSAGLNGNLAANRTFRTATISVTIPPGEEIMLRWRDINDTNEDHGLAVDDLNVTPRGVVLPAIGFASAQYGSIETGTAEIEVQRSGDLSGTSTVNYSTSQGTANGGQCMNGADFESASGTLSFAPNESTKTVSVPLCGDLVSELADESFTLILSDPTGAVLGTQTMASVSILDVASQFTNPAALITEPGVSAESAITVSGMSGTAYSPRVTLHRLTAGIADDLDVLLVSPGGTRFVLSADAGGVGGVSDITFTLQDSAPSAIADSSPPASGHYKPTSCLAPVPDLPAPAPAGPYDEPGCDGSGATLAGAFSGEDPNGTWRLYVRMSAPTGAKIGNVAVLDGGWGLQLMAPTAAHVIVGGRVVRADGIGIAKAEILIEGGDLAETRRTLTNAFGHYAFEGLTAGMTYVLTVNAKRHTFAVPSRIVLAGEDVEDADFIAEP